MSSPEPIADVEFSVSFENGRWIARIFFGEVFTDQAEGSTPITALMVAEAKARKAAKR